MSTDPDCMFRPLEEVAALENCPAKSKLKSSTDDDWRIVAPIPENDGLSPPREHPSKGLPSDLWDYRDEAGQLLGYTWRIDDDAGGKEFVYLTFWRRDKTGETAWRFKAWSTPRPLYGLDRLARSRDAKVVIVEGEKAADAAEKLLPGWVSVTSPGGSNAAQRADWLPLKGRDVVIWPDNDEPGKTYARNVAGELIKAGVSSLATIVPPAGVAGGWDAADALSEAWNTERAETFMANAATHEASAGKTQTPSDTGEEFEENASRGRRKRPPQRDLVLELLDDVEFWHDHEKEAYASYNVNGHIEHSRIRDKAFRLFVVGRFMIGQAHSVNLIPRRKP